MGSICASKLRVFRILMKVKPSQLILCRGPIRSSLNAKFDICWAK